VEISDQPQAPAGLSPGK